MSCAVVGFNATTEVRVSSRASYRLGCGIFPIFFDDFSSFSRLSPLFLVFSLSPSFSRCSLVLNLVSFPSHLIRFLPPLHLVYCSFPFSCVSLTPVLIINQSRSSFWASSFCSCSAPPPGLVLPPVSSCFSARKRTLSQKEELEQHTHLTAHDALLWCVPSAEREEQRQEVRA